MDIVTIGEVLIDLTQTGKDARGIPQFAANPGGAPANLAVAASRLGAQTAFIGKVGADAFGRYLKEVLAENKVDVSGMAVDADHPTTMAVVSVDATGERDFSFYRSANADVMLFSQRQKVVLTLAIRGYVVYFVQLRIAKVNLVTGTQDSSTSSPSVRESLQP